MIKTSITIACGLACGLSTATAAFQAEEPSEIDQAEVAEVSDGGSDEATVMDDGAAFRLTPTVVTARKLLEDSQDIPQSITVVSAQDIQDAGLRSIKDASVYVPNLYITEFTSRRLSFPFLRGIGSGQGDPAVTTYVDGVPQLAVSSTNLPLFGVERIEFLRGPQGTLYGRNSLGGLIHVITEKPSNTPLFEATTTFGNYDLQEFTARYAVPIVEDELYFDVSGMYSSRDGYTVNNFTGNDVDDRESLFGRGQLLWTPSDQSEVRFVIYGERARDGGFVLSDVEGLRASDHRIFQDFEGSNDRDILGTSLTWNYTGDAYDFTSISSYQNWDIDERSDFDFSALDAVRRFTEESQDYFTQEVRFASSADRPWAVSDTATVKWVVGALFFTSDSDRSAANEFRPGGAGIAFPPAAVGTDTAEGDFDDMGIGVFGQATVTLADRLDLTAGLRYDYEDKEAEIDRTFTSGGFVIPTASSDLDEDFDEFLPHFSAAYRVNDNFMPYALASRGFSAGGFNLTAPAGEETFDTETSWTYEAGVKSSWLDERLTVNAAYFYIDWDDMQLSQFNAATGGYVTNAGESTSQGIEIEVQARPSQGLELFGSFGYTDTEFDSFVDPFGTDVSGNDLPFAPETTWNIGAQYTGDFDDATQYFLRGEFTAINDFKFDPGNLGEESYELARFSAGLRGHNWKLEAWVANAFDDEYIAVALQPNPADPTSFVGENGAPRTFGVTFGLSF